MKPSRQPSEGTSLLWVGPEITEQTKKYLCTFGSFLHTQANFKFGYHANSHRAVDFTKLIVHMFAQSGFQHPAS